jgi:hypothetical protein
MVRKQLLYYEQSDESGTQWRLFRGRAISVPAKKSQVPHHGDSRAQKSCLPAERHAEPYRKEIERGSEAQPTSDRVNTTPNTTPRSNAPGKPALARCCVATDHCGLYHVSCFYRLIVVVSLALERRVCLAHSFSALASVSALCPLPSALCPLPSALCPLPSALCPLPSALFHQQNIMKRPPPDARRPTPDAPASPFDQLTSALFTSPHLT